MEVWPCVAVRGAETRASLLETRVLLLGSCREKKNHWASMKARGGESSLSVILHLDFKLYGFLISIEVREPCFVFHN